MPANASNEFIRKAPYAPWKTFRDKLWNKKIRRLTPTNVTAKVLKDAWELGASCHKHHSALVFLGIIQKDGTPCEDVWNSLQSSQETEYRKAVQHVVRKAYAKVFESLKDLQAVTDGKLEDIMRQQYRVAKTSRPAAVGFFKGICKEAGIEVGPEEQAKEGEHKTRREKALPKDKPRREVLPAAASPVAFQIVVDPTASEDELVELFRRAQAAWRKALESD